ncbi:hypothetical protein GALMADRAFT_139387 [Galerina marginata CBS 339.88]|uniref:Uncharacterized protein n=1 Tax=Galerina marginata (strain CBS 339.88) TaxID=685588 RepID=A0A067T9A6_GALM3|nr:hypothetical protein GALMADRAFT_139387 [Galerina marginata CBS 339.88]
MNGAKNWFLAIPFEIIDKIFVECLPTGFQPLHPQYAPLLLTHVCSFWRTFALNCPNLWKKFSLESSPIAETSDNTAEGIFARRQQKMLQQIALWRSASKGPRLTVSLDLEHTVPLQSKEPVWHEHIQAVLVDHIESIHKLRLFISWANEANPLLRLPGQRLCNLEYLHLYVWAYPPEPSLVEHLSVAPNLRRFQLAVRRGDVKSVLLHQQLTHLYLLDYTIYYGSPKLHTILQSFPALKSLSMFVCQVESKWNINDSTIVMHHLTDLSLTFEIRARPGPPFDVSVFNEKSFPVLNYLQLACKTNHRYDNWSMLHHPDQAHFLSQLRLLRTLVLTNQIIPGDELLELLHSTPLLVKLSVESDLQNYFSFFDGLTYHPFGAGLEQNRIPKLEEFAIYVDTAESSTDDGFEVELIWFKESMLLMIQSRCPSRHEVLSINDDRPARLRKFLLCTDSGGLKILIPDGLDEINSLLTDGLDFESREVAPGSADEWAVKELSFW